ncbi:DUF2071 domain-containing protein [Panacibacter sp. DH6]|uniref:DUF2071 domain-containing protein n=1 Tax=Panacibacter microcysteis TaxID=2793269 RepID=A0A931E7H1_9BACT|nr:DUF2071 domain-containing protein [Panacibacter microcysteis]MBG9376821.1 DUF2071 domain-containing protein [Panacibacter microcysteis]
MQKRKFLSASWEYLAMFNYEIDAAILQQYIPPYTEPDLFDGRAMISIVGFLFNNTRVLGVKWPGFVNFEEVNLRYYIRHFNGSEWERGVGFVSEIVPSAVIAKLANGLFNEHYSTALMSHSIQSDKNELNVSYKWKRHNEEWNSMELVAENTLTAIVPGSEEEFILEHYVGYNGLNKKTTVAYRVEHPAWQVFKVRDHKLQCNVERLYGKSFVPFVQHVQPRSVFLARGSAVNVRMPSKITAATF